MNDVDVLRLLDAIQIFERKLNLALMYYGLRLPQYRVLDILDKVGKITVSDLSRKLDVTRATMSVLVTKMQKAGLVSYLDNKMDKRSFYIRLTEAGQLRLRSAEQAFQVMQKRMCESLPEATIAALNAFALGVRQDAFY
ncbi:MAG: MarR family transcriptional regulator [Gammaproteobacteria bacterium]|nr:MarR family transcriptional regulator [Gammaproteobacteria bacterium]